MKKKSFLLICILQFIFALSLFAGDSAKSDASKDFGKQKEITSNTCSYEGGYSKGQDYDVPAYLKYFKIEVVKPYVLRVTFEAPGVKEGDIYSMFFYQPGDKKYVPSKDLNVEPDSSIQNTWLGIHFLVLKKNGQLSLAPVIYKTGFRGKDDFKKDIYMDIFKGFDTVTSPEGKKLGTSGNFYTFFMNTVKGSHRFKTLNSIRLNDKDQFIFDINISDDIAQKWFFIMSAYKGDPDHEKRGFRSSITTSTLDISKACSTK